MMRTNFDPKMSFEDSCRAAAKRGVYGFDLAGAVEIMNV